MIFFSSLRSRSRVRSSSACSSSMVARSAGSGTIEVSSRRCSVVSPALDSTPSLSSVSLPRKNSICLAFMYSASGMASTSASVSSAPDLVFQALASLGSALAAVLGLSITGVFIWRVGGFGGANRSAKRLPAVGGGLASSETTAAASTASALGLAALAVFAAVGLDFGAGVLLTFRSSLGSYTCSRLQSGPALSRLRQNKSELAGTFGGRGL